MNISLFSLLALSYIVITIIVGKYYSNIDPTRFFASDNKFGIWPLAMTFLATQLGGGAIIGASDIAYKYGWYAIYYASGITLGLLALSFGLGNKLRELEINTVPAIFIAIYEDKLMHKIASIFYVISTFLVLIAIAVASKKFLLSIGFNSLLIYLLFWITLVSYTAMGGLQAVIYTDIIQISFVIVVFALVGYHLYDSNIVMVSKHTSESIPWESWLLMPLMYTIIGQDMGQRCFVSSSSKAVSLSTRLAGILLVLASLLPIYIGILGNGMEVNISEQQSVLISVANQLLHPNLATLLAFAVLLAIISTADSLLCALSSNISLDIIAKDNNKSLLRMITIACGMVACIIGLLTNDILSIMVFAYSLTITGFFVPIIFAIATKQPKRQGARFSSACGVTSYLSLLYIGTPLPELVALVTATLVYLISPKS